MSKDTDFLRSVILCDADTNKSKIIGVKGAESELDHLEILTQSSYEKEHGIATKHRIYSEEVTV